MSGGQTGFGGGGSTIVAAEADALAGGIAPDAGRGGATPSGAPSDAVERAEALELPAASRRSDRQAKRSVVAATAAATTGAARDVLVAFTADKKKLACRKATRSFISLGAFAAPFSTRSSSALSPRW